MGKRYLEIEVTKEQTSSIYLEVDEEDPRFAEIFKAIKAKELGKMFQRHRMPEEIHKLVLLEASDLDDLDWSDPDYSASWFPIETTEKTAKDYGVTEVTPLTQEKAEESGHSGPSE